MKKSAAPEFVLIDGFGYYVYADGPMVDATTLWRHVETLRASVAQARSCHSPLNVLFIKCGGGEALALYHGGLSTVHPNWAPRTEFGERPHAGPDALWAFFEFFRDTGPATRRSLRALFGNMYNPPSRFVLAGVRPDEG